MNKTLRLIALILLLAAPVWAQTGATERVKGEVTRSLQEGVEAWNAGDLDRFMTGYVKTPDMTFTAGGRVVRGYEALQQRYQTTYGTSKASMGQLRFENIEVWELGPNFALALGEWIVLLPGKGVGEQIRGVFSLVLERTGDGWKILHDHTSRLDETKRK